MLDKVHRKLPNFVLTVICCVIVIFFVGCGPKSETENIEDQNSQNVVEVTTNENTEDDDAVFHIDLTKISPLIQENVSEDVVVAAKTVIEGFLRYECSGVIKISGNCQRFLNDMAYVIHCTCPMFGAFTDFNEMSS